MQWKKGDNIRNIFLIFYLERKYISVTEIFIGASISNRNLLSANTILSYSDSEHFSTFAALRHGLYLALFGDCLYHGLMSCFELLWALFSEKMCHGALGINGFFHLLHIHIQQHSLTFLLRTLSLST